MKIDFHTHAIISKKFPFNPEQVVLYANYAREFDLDAISLTEHLHARDYLKVLDFLERKPQKISDGIYRLNGAFLISGAEVSVREMVDGIPVHGDAVIIAQVESLRALHDAFQETDEGLTIRCLKEFMDGVGKPYILIAAHLLRVKEGCKEPLAVVGPDRLHLFDALEINGKDYKSERPLRELAYAIDRPLVGSSDAHWATQLGTVCTHFHRHHLNYENLSIENIKKNIHAFHTGYVIDKNAEFKIGFAKFYKTWVKNSAAALNEPVEA